MAHTSYRWASNPILVGGGALRLGVLLILLFVAIAATIIVLYVYPQQRFLIVPLQIALLLLCVLVLFILARRVYLEIIQPISSVRSWASRIREGDYSAQFTLPSRGEFASLLRELSQMGRWYKEIGVESEQQMSNQVLQMARKTRLLEILYDIAATISVSRDLNEVLKRFLHISLEITHGRAALVRLTADDGDMALLAAIGERSDKYQARIPLVDVIPKAGSKINSVYVIAPSNCPDFKHFADDSVEDDSAELECVIVPLLHQGEVKGAYAILIDQAISSMSYDLHELLTSMGFHLGLAVHKAHLDAEAQQQTISKERLILAHELHDSLAQSMAGMRFQSKVLQDSIAQANLKNASEEIARLYDGIERANMELRALLAHFRAPIDQRGLVAALDGLLKQFREQNDVLVFSQFECHDVAPPLHVQRQVIRIVQEGLANIHKHAKASIVRLMLRVFGENKCHLLLEDDGHGFAMRENAGGEAGRHIGIKVMQERADFIGAQLTIESEVNEGTRVELIFHWDI